MASFSYPDSCAYTPSDLTIFKMKVIEDMAALSDKKAALAFLLQRCGAARDLACCSDPLSILVWNVLLCLHFLPLACLCTCEYHSP